MTSPAASIDLRVPHVWRGRELAQAVETTLPSGHAALDAQLPGGGWPVGCLVEVLQAQPGQHVWQLLAPALARSAGERAGPLVLVDAPHVPFGPALQGRGLAAQLLCVRAGRPAAALWATEQALRCADVAAVLAWLPRVRSEELRRLHLCAQQHDKLLFALRPAQAAGQSSPARLRLLVEGFDALEVSILKRRGPPLLRPVLLPAQPARLAALLAARQSRRTLPAVPPVSLPGASHVLDRTASYAE